MIDESKITDHKVFDDDKLYTNLVTTLYEWVERPEYAHVTGLVLEIPGFLFAQPDPEHPQALIIFDTELAYEEPGHEETSLIITPGAPVSPTEDPTQLEVREA